MAKQNNTNHKQKENGTQNIIELVKQTLREDAGFYTSTLILLGYLFTTVQQIVRYAYYGVELTYLLSIKLEDILLGLNYVIIISLMPILAYEFARAKSKILWKIVKQFAFIVVLTLFAFALTQRIPVDFAIIFSVVQVGADVLAKRLLKVHSSRKHRKNVSVLSSLSSLILTLILVVCFLQLAIESYNKRFTYIHVEGSEYVEDREYIVLTTFQDNYITIESEITDDW